MQPEVSMTPEEAMLLLDAAIMECQTVTGKASFEAAGMVREKDAECKHAWILAECITGAEVCRHCLRVRASAPGTPTSEEKGRG